MSEHEALPKFELRLPIGFHARDRARRGESRGDANARESDGLSLPYFAGAPRSGRPQLVAATSGDRRDASPASVGKDALDHPHDADVACTSAQILAHGDADVMLSRRLHAQDDVARRNDHARRAITALQRMMSRERRPQFARDLVLIEALYRGDFGVFTSDSKGDAGAYWHAVDE
jgi:hypothetical protein